MEKELLNSGNELLLKDLCARLPYGVKCIVKSDGYVGVISSIESQYRVVTFDDGRQEEICDIKPYLFPLSSMTEEQREEFLNIQTEERQILLNALIEYKSGKYDKIPIIAPYKQIEWLNKNHFDYRGLIEKGLSIDCTNLNIY